MAKAEENVPFLKNAQDQITEILREFEKGCDEAIIRREGKRLILEPKKRIPSVTRGLEQLNKNALDSDLSLLPLGDIRI